MSTIEKALKAAKGAAAPKTPSSDSDLSTPREALNRGGDFLVKADPDAPTLNRSSVAPDEEAVPTASPDAAVSEASGMFADSDLEAASANGSGQKKPTLILPLVELQEKGFLIPHQPRSRIAEEYRTIKRPLLRNIFFKGAERLVENANLVMVTSALQGDGKTFSSINLALSMAMEQDKSVLFVDADVVRATAGKTLGVPKGSLGLIELLDEQQHIDPADVIMRTNIPNLRVLPAGNASDKSTELLASETMHHFMLELSKRYPDRVIVFDSPPLLLTTEASVLASFMGQIVFVASADITPQHAVQEALEQLGNDKIIGVMLNRASRRRSKLLGIGSYGYGYGYGYGDSDGHSEGREPKVSEPVSKGDAP